MPEQNYFKQVDEKHVSAVVEHMAWSPKMDLISLANGQGEVILYRLWWQKVWTLAAPAEGVAVTALAWRPDGKVVAIGYSTGKLLLCDIENADVLHEAEIQGEVTHLSWVLQTLPPGESWSSKPYPEDTSDIFLPKLQSLSKSYGSLNKGQSEDCAEDSKRLKGQTLLNILVVGSDLDIIHLYAFGVFPLAYIQLGVHTETKPCKVLSAVVSQDMLTLSIYTAVKEDDGHTDYFLLSYDMALVASRHKEVRLLALKYGQVYSLITYMKATIQQMSEAWEDILMEMDSKLLNFAEEKKRLGTGAVSTDFLELLLFGTSSPELEAFLLHKLTEKGLKKLGHSIETSYSNIQKLVVKHLQNVSQAVLYQLSELRGMSLWYDKFGVLGLSTPLLQEALSTTGSFILKTSELQQVIDGSIKNFKAFFRWLYVVIMRLSEEQPPQELNKMTQYDVNFVAEFLKDNFSQFSEEEGQADNSDILDNISTMDETKEEKPGFKLEKVGQYLKKEDLPCPSENNSNPWNQFIKSCGKLKDSDQLYRVEAERSLIQLQERLEEKIQSALSQPATVIGKFLMCSNKLHLFSSEAPSPEETDLFSPTITQFTVNESHKLYTVFTSDPKPADKFYVMRQTTETKKEEAQCEVVCLSVGLLAPPEGDPDTSSSDRRPQCSCHKILDLAFYDEKTLSLLLAEDTEESVPVLAQFSLAALEDHMFRPVSQSAGRVTSMSDIQTVDIGPLIDANNRKVLENMKAWSFAVSGTRKVACVLFSSRRRVRVFLMDMEEEEEEGEESQLESEASLHNNSLHSNSLRDDSRHEESMVGQEANTDENKENTGTGTTEVLTEST